VAMSAEPSVAPWFMVGLAGALPMSGVSPGAVKHHAPKAPLRRRQPPLEFEFLTAACLVIHPPPWMIYL